MQTGVVPQDFKIAKVLPLFKDGDPAVFNNYRPISILPCFSKILEKLVYTRVIKHLNSNNILYNHQYGFRKQHSTYMALMQLTERVQEALNKNTFALGIFLDISKAFDTVDHQILLDKLKRYGFCGTVLKWLGDYLVDRQQFVCIEKQQSDNMTISCGVPQGSVLGPLLFLIFINDFAFQFDTALPIIFADDTNIIFSNSNFLSLVNQANNILAKTARWFQKNRLSLNINKTNYMIFKHKNKIYSSADSKLFIGDSEIQQVSQTKFLGVIVEESLTWNAHVEWICKKITKSCGIIRRISSLISRQCSMTLYYSLIFPYLSYCNIIWGSTYYSTLQKLYLVQKKFVRLATNSNYLASSAPLFKQLKILSVYEINTFQVCIFVFNCTKNSNSFPEVFHDFFKTISQIHSYSTRQTGHIHSAFSRTTLGQFSIKFRGPSIWNAIPSEIREYTSLPLLKKRLKMLLIDDE